MNFANLKKNWALLGFRSRLILGLSGLFAVILTLGYWAVFMEFQAELKSEFDRSLYNYATDLLESVQLTPGGEADLPFHVIFSAEKVFPFPHGDALVKIFRYPFFELFSFSSDKDAPTDLSFLEEGIRSKKDNQFYSIKTPKGDRWRGVLMQVDDSPVPSIYFFVAVPRDTLTSQEGKFRSIFIAGQLITFLISAFMISVLAKNMLRPLEKLTTSIDYVPLTEKEFEVPEGPPEVASLANVLNRLLRQVRKSLLAHQEFVAQAAHQLKTPLTIAKGHLEQLETQNHSSHLHVALEEIDYMSGTIANLLNLVQIESGFQNLKMSEVELLDLVLNCIDRHEYLARKKGLKFQIQCIDSETPQQNWLIFTDAQFFTIIINNLLDNAIKYAVESPIEVVVEAINSNFQITITNLTSHKYDQNMLLKLKEKFVRGLTLESGQGLGLYIAMKIAEALKVEFNLYFQNEKFSVVLKIPSISS